MDFIKEYTDWLYNNTTQEQIEDDLIEITTPFLDRHNDYTQIYIILNKGKPYKLSDLGYTISDLYISGFELSSKKRQDILKVIVNRNGVNLEEGVLFVNINNLSEIPLAKHKLLQAMLSINDMFVLNRENISNIFFEEVSNYFELNNISYIENITFIGKSNLQNSYDFTIPKSKGNPERIINVVNTMNITKSKQIIFSWNDISPTRKSGTINYVIINDKNNVNDEAISALKNYGILPILWSKINENIALFK